MESKPAIAKRPPRVFMLARFKVTWKKLISVAISLCIGGLVGALVAAFPTMFAETFDATGGHHSVFAPINLIVFGMIAAIFFTIPASLLFGLPAFFVLRRFRSLNLLSVTCVGLASGTIVGVTVLNGIVFTGVPFWYFPVIGVVSAVSAFLAMTYIGGAVIRSGDQPISNRPDKHGSRDTI